MATPVTETVTPDFWLHPNPANLPFLTHTLAEYASSPEELGTYYTEQHRDFFSRLGKPHYDRITQALFFPPQTETGVTTKPTLYIAPGIPPPSLDFIVYTSLRAAALQNNWKHKPLKTLGFKPQTNLLTVYATREEEIDIYFGDIDYTHILSPEHFEDENPYTTNDNETINLLSRLIYKTVFQPELLDRRTISKHKHELRDEYELDCEEKVRLLRGTAALLQSGLCRPRIKAERRIWGVSGYISKARFDLSWLYHHAQVTDHTKKLLSFLVTEARMISDLYDDMRKTRLPLFPKDLQKVINSQNPTSSQNPSQ